MIKTLVKRCLPDSTRERLSTLLATRELERVGVRFSFRYFGDWELTRLQRDIGRQLPSGLFRLTILRACVDEYVNLRSILTDPAILPKQPACVMDFGCGLGRSSIFFRKAFGWTTAKFLFVDGHRDVYGPKDNLAPSQRGFHPDMRTTTNSFYTDFDLLDRFVTSDDVTRYDILDVTRDAARLSQVRDVDVFYSFHAVGYHDAIRPGGLLILGVRRAGDPLRQLPDEQRLRAAGYERVAEVPGQQLQDFLVPRRLRSA